MGLGADLLNLTQSDRGDFLKNTWAAINRLGDELTDRLVNGSGWVTIVLSSGYTPLVTTSDYTPQVRKIGSRLYTRGAINATTSSGAMAANSVYSVGTMPAGFIPLQTGYFPCIGSNGNSSAVINYNSAGTVQIRTGSTVPTYYFVNVPAMFTD